MQTLARGDCWRSRGLFVPTSALSSVIVVVGAWRATSVSPSVRATATVASATLVRRTAPGRGPILPSAVSRSSAVAAATAAVVARWQSEPVAAGLALSYEIAVLAGGEPQGRAALSAGTSSRSFRVEPSASFRSRGSFGSVLADPFELRGGFLGHENGRCLTIGANDLERTSLALPERQWRPTSFAFGSPLDGHGYAIFRGHRGSGRGSGKARGDGGALDERELLRARRAGAGPQADFALLEIHRRATVGAGVGHGCSQMQDFGTLITSPCRSRYQIRPSWDRVNTGDRRRMSVNRRKWDESVPLHVASHSYDVPSFLRGRSTLRSLELREMGPVKGKTLLHLQCHFGLDTLSWARRGADVTGVDFSPPAIRAAQHLARQVGITARFARSNVYDLPDRLDQRFDIVYTGKGAICWLPDIDRWAAVVAHFLRPGGRFFFLEDHPIVELFPNEADTTELQPKIPYFGARALREEYDGTYATGAKMRHRVTYSWIHPVSELLSALVANGLDIESVREYPYSYWHRFPFMKEDAQGWWRLTKSEGLIPLMWSVTATRRPGTSR